MLDLTFGSGFRLNAVLAGHSGNRGRYGNPSVLGLDFVEAEQQARMESAFQVAHVALDLGAHGNPCSISRSQILHELGFELLSGRVLGGVERVLELDLKLRVRRDHIGCARSLVTLIEHRSLAHIDLSESSQRGGDSHSQPYGYGDP